jgi:hypothetical protein
MRFIAPDYVRNAVEIFTDACFKTFELDSSLLVLQFLEDPAWREIRDCPSWCPD